MRYSSIILIVGIILCLNISPAISAEGTKSIPEGMKDYIPTRLEWLAVELNAMYRTDMHDLKGYLLFFIPIEKENTILIFVRYTPQTDRKAMNIGIDAARKVIEINAKSRGWNSWLKVKERIELATEDKGYSKVGNAHHLSH